MKVRQNHTSTADGTGGVTAERTGGVTADGTRPWSITLYPSATYTLQGAPFCAP